MRSEWNKNSKKKRAQKTSSPCWEKLEIEMSTSTPKHKRKSEHEKLEFWSDRCDVSAPTDLRSETSKRIKQKTRVFKALFFWRKAEWTRTQRTGRRRRGRELRSEISSCWLCLAHQSYWTAPSTFGFRSRSSPSARERTNERSGLCFDEIPFDAPCRDELKLIGRDLVESIRCGWVMRRKTLVLCLFR